MTNTILPLPTMIFEVIATLSTVGKVVQKYQTFFTKFRISPKLLDFVFLLTKKVFL